jgi:hypothetical protein
VFIISVNLRKARLFYEVKFGYRGTVLLSVEANGYLCFNGKEQKSLIKYSAETS